MPQQLGTSLQQENDDSGNSTTAVDFPANPFPASDAGDVIDYDAKTLTRTVKFVYSDTYAKLAGSVKDDNGQPVPDYQEKFRISARRYMDFTTDKQINYYKIEDLTTGKTTIWSSDDPEKSPLIDFSHVQAPKIKGWISGRTLHPEDSDPYHYKYFPATADWNYYSKDITAADQYIEYEYDDSTFKPGDPVPDDLIHDGQGSYSVLSTDTYQRIYRYFYYGLDDENDEGVNYSFPKHQRFGGRQMLEFTRTKTVNADGTVTYGQWTPKTTNTFPVFQYPRTAGYDYEADGKEPAETYDPNNGDNNGSGFTNVTFVPFMPLYEVRIIDDTNPHRTWVWEKEPVPEDPISEYPGASNFTKKDVYKYINQLKNQGYVVVSDHYQGKVSPVNAENAAHSDGSDEWNKYIFDIHVTKLATQHTESKVLSRTIHYVPSDNHSKQLQNDTRQSVKLNGTYFVDHSGNMVNAKQVRDVNGNTVWVVDTSNTVAPKETWMVDTTATDNQGVSADGKSFVTINGPETLTLSNADAQARGVKSGYWNYVDGADSTALFDVNGNPVSQLADGYVEYKQDDAAQTKTVNEVIHYVKTDGSKAADDYTATALNFTRTGTKDKNGHTIWSSWTADQSFAAQNSPVVTGYTPDKTSVPAITVTVGDTDRGLTGTAINATVNGDSTDPAMVVRTVTYTANNQTAKITYIDDTTGETLKTDSADGKYNAAIDFSTSPSDQITTYEGQGYELVSNDFDNQKYSNDNSKNVFEVHLKHGTTTVSRDKDVKQTIHYQYSDGTTAQPDNVQTLHFTETGTKDLVTGEAAYTPAASQSYTTVTTPAITGYTPDKDSVPSSSVDYDSDDSEITVAYAKNDQAAGITYIDDTTGQALKTNTAAGKYGDAIEFSTDPSSQITDYEGQGYELVSNDFDHQTYQTDNAKNQFIVHLKHGTQMVARDRIVTQTINYVYENGAKAADSNVQTVTFHENGTKDKVTGQTTWTPAASQSYTAVTSPTITGYTPDKDSVPGSSVDYDSEGSAITVTYSAMSQPTNASQSTSVTTPMQPTNASQPTSVTSPTQPTNASQLTSVTSPTQPTNASQPTSVTTPTQPMNASQPTSITSPTQPANASQPTSVTSPTQPTNASQPTSVTTSTQPTNTSQPTSVTSPTQPTNASQPTSVTTPMQPTNASQPTSVTSPTQPTNASQPTSVTTPTQPTNASQPTSVTSPTQPTNISQPTSVTSPTQSTNVSRPTSVTSPTQPTNASQPTSVTPISPAQPTRPVQNSGAVSNINVAVPQAANKQGQATSQSTAAQEKLPQTGNYRESGALALGLSSLALLFGLVGKKRKQD